MPERNPLPVGRVAFGQPIIPEPRRVQDWSPIERGLRTELHEVEQILGRALGYPRFCDDQQNFPGTTDADGVCIGAQTAVTLALEAARAITGEKRQRAWCRWSDGTMTELDRFYWNHECDNLCVGMMFGPGVREHPSASASLVLGDCTVAVDLQLIGNYRPRPGSRGFYYMALAAPGVDTRDFARRLREAWRS